jgi:hypothetical protein
MKTQAYFTCQIEPGSFILQDADFHTSKRRIIAQMRRISGWALLFIMAIATFSTFNAVQSASIKSSLKFEDTQINEYMENSGMNALAAINNTPTKEEMFLISKNADFMPKNDFITEQFPIYIPFYFFFLGFILVLAQHWILLKSHGHKKEENNKTGLKEIHEQNLRSSYLITNFQSKAGAPGRNTLMSVPMSN